MEDIKIPAKFEDLFVDECSSIEYGFPANIQDLQINNYDFPVLIAQLEEYLDEESEEGFLFQFHSLQSKTSLTVDQEIILILRYFTYLSSEVHSMTFTTLLELTKFAIDYLSKESSLMNLNEEVKVIFKKVFFYYIIYLQKMEDHTTQQKTASAMDASAAATTKKGGSKAAKKTKTSTGFEWNHEQRSSALQVLADILATPFLSAIWSMGMIEENYLNLVNHYLLYLLDNKIFAGINSEESSLRQLTQSIIIKTLSFYDSNSLSTIVVSAINSITRYEHMALLLSDLCAKESLITRRQMLTRELLTEMSNMILQQGGDSNATINLTVTTIKNISIFIENYSKLDAKHMISLFFSSSSLLTLLGCSAHQLRSSVIQSMGYVIMAIDQVIATSNGLDEIFGNEVNARDEDEESSPKEEEQDEEKKSSDKAEEDSFSDEESVTRKPPALSHEEKLQRLSHQREDLLTLLIERKLDTNPYTRANVLKMMIQLIEKEVIPVKHYTAITDMAISRLMDKNVLVRKYAISLLTTLIENNPFSSILSREIFETKWKEFANQEILSEEGQFIKMALEFITSLETILSTKIIHFLKSKNGSDILESLVLFSCMVNFNLSQAIYQFRETFQLIFHQDLNIQKEVIHSFISVYFMNGKKDAIHPAPSTDSIETAAKERTVSSLQYIPLSTKEMAYNLVKLLTICSKEDLVCVEEIIKKMIAPPTSSATGNNGATAATTTAALNLNLPLNQQHWKEIIQYSYQFLLKYSENFQKERMSNARRDSQYRRQSSLLFNLTEHQKRLYDTKLPSSSPSMGENSPTRGSQLELMSLVGASITAISMVFTASSTASWNSNFFSLEMLQKIVDIGLKKNVEIDAIYIDEIDFHAMKATVTVLQSYLRKDAAMKRDESLQFQQFSQSSLQLLIDAITITPAKLSFDTIGGWYAVCEECIHTIYKIHHSPDVVMEFCIKALYEFLTAQDYQSSELLGAFFFILGQTAVDTLVEVERVGKAMKNHLLTDASKKEEDKKEKKRAGPGGEGGADGNIDDFEEQMGIAQAVDADFETEMYQLTENGLVSPAINPEMLNLLGQFLPLIKYIVANETKEFSNPNLRHAAVLTLCRFMSVSSVLCEENLPLLFTILSTSPSSSSPAVDSNTNTDQILLKTTILIALGDLAFRFPNVLEPWTAHIYARLADSNNCVRYNALMVITHLVLNDMIKVKGQVSQIAITLVDEEENIQKLSKLFFIKLSERSNNPLYNLLGDIISRLSNQKEDEDSSVSLMNTTVLGEEGSLASSSSERGLDLLSSYYSSASLSAMMGISTSSPQKTVTSEEFVTIMHFLLTFIQKDKQADSLLERLLTRLSMAETVKQRQNLAYCISELNVSEKGLKKLLEMIKNIKLALQDQTVFEYFRILVSKAKKSKSAANNNSTNAEEGAPAVANGSQTTEKIGTAIIAEVEKALHEAIQEKNLNPDGTGDAEDGTAGTDRVRSEDTEISEIKKTSSKGAINKKSTAATKKGGASKSKPPLGKSKKGGKKKSKALSSDDEEEEEDIYNISEDEAEDEDADQENKKVNTNKAFSKMGKGKPAATISKPKSNPTIATVPQKRNNRVVIEDEDEEY